MMPHIYKDISQTGHGQQCSGDISAEQLGHKYNSPHQAVYNSSHNNVTHNIYRVSSDKDSVL